MAKVAFHTLGCKVNQYETEAMMAKFEQAGYEIVSFNEEATVYIVNTCTVTNMADKKSRQMLSKAKQMNKDGLVVAVGCYVQAASETLDSLEHVDLLIGNTDKGNIVELVESYYEKSIQPVVSDMRKHDIYDDMWLGSNKHGHTRAHVKIQDGCDQFCSYCIIPYARGRVRSRQQESVIKEVQELSAQGFKEIVLTGIHLASYGKEKEESGLIDLLEVLDEIDGIERIRLGSLEPTLITQDFVIRAKKLKKLCDHFHLSLQSGNDEILKAMNRKYDTKVYEEGVHKLREAFPACAITTDLIVGFPGETKDQFEKTLTYLKHLALDDVHVFKYSIREGTKAAKMTNQVDGSLKQQRSQEAMDLVAKIKNEKYKRTIGQTFRVLFEAIETINGKDYNVGHSSNYIKFYLPNALDLNVNNLVLDVHVRGLIGEGLLCDLVG